MCELLGMSFNHPVRPKLSFPGLIKGAWYNTDGWGVGYYPEGSRTAQIFKEPYNGDASQLAAFLENYERLWTKLFIGHIRKASRSDNVHHNTHPFSRYYGNREWLFCHNGTLPKRKTVPGQTYVPIGGTDSELAFCTLLNKMKRQKIKSATKSRYTGFTELDFDYIYKALRDINGTGRGSFNVIFTDGVYLFCYRDKYGARKLNYPHREYPFHSTLLRGTDVEVDLLVTKDGNDDRGYVIATQELSDEEWIAFKYGEMIVFRGGEIIAKRY
jgi:predicted glutamine amidotransferase